MNGGVHWIDLNEPEQTKGIAHHQKGVYGIKKIQDHLFTIGGVGMLTRWSVETQRTLESLQLSNMALRCLDYHPGRNEIAVGASDHHIYLIDADTMEVKKTILKAHDNTVFSLRYAPDGKFLLSGGRDAHLNIWVIDEDFRQHSTRPAHWFTINDIAFSPSGDYFATASRDKTIKIWDAKDFELLKVIEGVRDGGHFNSVNRLLWSAYQDLLISCSDDRSMILWQLG